MVEGNPALNRVSWTNSGQQITVGDDMGKIWIYDVGEVSICTACNVLILSFCTFSNTITGEKLHNEQFSSPHKLSCPEDILSLLSLSDQHDVYTADSYIRSRIYFQILDLFILLCSISNWLCLVLMTGPGWCTPSGNSKTTRLKMIILPDIMSHPSLPSHPSPPPRSDRHSVG